MPKRIEIGRLCYRGGGHLDIIGTDMSCGSRYYATAYIEIDDDAEGDQLLSLDFESQARGALEWLANVINKDEVWDGIDKN